MPPIEAASVWAGVREPRPEVVGAVEWRLVVEPEGRGGAENMAVDAELLEDAAQTGAAYLRLYRFRPACLSLGRNEATQGHRAAIARLGWDVVRRPTGGGAVWHEDEVTYAVAAPIAVFGGLRRAYRAIHARLAAALEALGAVATLAPARRRPSPGARAAGLGGPCFHGAAGGEVLLGGRKVVGSAQVRSGSAFLQHGSILVAGSQDLVAAVTQDPPPGPVVAPPATSLSAVLGRDISWTEVVRAILAAWHTRFTPAAPVRARPGVMARFRDPGWTWRR